MVGGLISSCTPTPPPPRNAHGKAGNEEREIEFARLLENGCPFKSQNNQVDGFFNQPIVRENVFSSDLA